jgi:glycosyltransferase involved in cell wall biosynthesis
MRIGLDLTCLKAPMGGYERYASRLLDALVRLPGDHRMVAFTENAYGPKLVPVGAEGHALATLPRFLLKVLLQDQTYWPWLMRRAGVDVVHTPIFAGMVAAPRPYVLTLHDLIPLQTPEAVSRSAAAYWRLVLPRSVARADAIITGSDFTRREILDWFGLPPERVVTVWHGVDPCFAPVDDEATRARVRARYRLPARFLLFVGIASPRKNIDRLVQAFGALRDDERGDAHLLLAGPAGWKNEALEAAIAASPVASRIRHLGVVADADLPALYGLAAGVANLSSREGFGLPALEALACGAPLVCADRTSFPEVVGDAAWLVDPDDGAAVTRALATVLAGGAQVESQRARGLVRARAFTWERAAAATLAVYRRVVA